MEAVSLGVANRGVRRIREPINSSFTPIQALRSLRGDNHVFCLTGEWFGSGAVLGSEPGVVEDPSQTDDPFEVLNSFGKPDSSRAQSDTPLDRKVLDCGSAVWEVGEGIFGGWVGYLGYEATATDVTEQQPGSGPDAAYRSGADSPSPGEPPGWWLGWYDHVLRFDPSTGWWFEALATPERSDELARRYSLLKRRLSAAPPSAQPFQCSEFTSTPDDMTHREAVATVIDRIKAGYLEQANVCLQFQARLQGPGLDLFAEGAARLKPRFGAYLDLGSGNAVASFSPEQFLRRRGRQVSSSPIKGTRPRTGEEQADSAARGDLLSSTKERSENHLIVRQISREFTTVCRSETVEVPALFRVEPHPGLWHLVSEITGILEPHITDGALLQATFPPTSVTGSPKTEAQAAISEVETSPRHIYTGAIGMVSPVAGADWSVAIRAFEITGDQVVLGSGGGITVDSDPDAEFEECFVKARPLIAAIGAELVEDEPGPKTVSAPPPRGGGAERD